MVCNTSKSPKSREIIAPTPNALFIKPSHLHNYFNPYQDITVRPVSRPCLPCTLFLFRLIPVIQLCDRYNLQLAQSKYYGLHYVIEVSNCTKMLCSCTQRVFMYNSPLFSYFNFQILTQIFCIAVRHSVSV